MNMLSTPLSQLNITPRQALLLSEHASLKTAVDLLGYYPYRYEDRSRIYPVSSLKKDMHPVQVQGTLRHAEIVSTKGKRRLVATLKDDTGSIELVWFNKISWIQRFLHYNHAYLVFGQPSQHQGKFSITHPELVEVTEQTDLARGILPLYASSQKLVQAGMDNRSFIQLQRRALKVALPYIEETLPPYFLKKYGLLSRSDALSFIHFPPSKPLLAKARYRLKFEELLYLQLHLLQRKKLRKISSEGQIFTDTSLLKQYYHDHLCFVLTDDQKKVIKEICGRRNAL